VIAKTVLTHDGKIINDATKRHASPGSGDKRAATKLTAKVA